MPESLRSQTTPAPKHAPAGRGKKFNVVGDTVTLVLSAADTGGAFEIYEAVSPVGGGSPPHVHRREEETFHVLEGELEFNVGGRKIRGAVGDTMFAPRDVPHFVRNAGAKAARFLIVVSPATLEGFFAEVDRLMRAGPPNPQKLGELAGRYGIELLPPPG